ncbi:MAG: SGNH/GDSL hydrolase family protein [Acidimicrobiales bacterium]|jgi:hypothetical protein|nr:SGNH/GDSL hydrolase family protein [Acidimicrobiales bacterium]
MQQLDLTGGPAEWEGIAEVRPARDEGVMISRVPRRHKHLFGDMMGMMVRTPSGVRLRFRTDSANMVVRHEASRITFPGREVQPPVLDASVDGAAPSSYEGEGGTVVRIDMSVEPPIMATLGSGPARFEIPLPGDLVDVEIWLPHNATGALIAVELDDDAVIEAPTPDDRPKWVHYGSSISQCSEAHSPSRVWPAVAAGLGGWNLYNLGLGGSCHLDQFIAQQMRDLPADRISCKIGINIVGGGSLTERTFRPALHAFLDTVRDGHPETPIILASPIWCPYLETDPGPRSNVDGLFQDGAPNPIADALTLTWVRDYLAEAVAFRTEAGDANITYLDGFDLFSSADAADLPDNLHPNGDGYVRMGERWHALVD